MQFCDRFQFTKKMKKIDIAFLPLYGLYRTQSINASCVQMFMYNVF